MSSGARGKAPLDRDSRKTAEFYDLKTDAIEDLVTANEQNSPKVSPAAIRKYTARGRFHLADWVKVLLIKWWFSAAVCFFFLWGLGTMVPSVLDQLVITGLALGFVTDLLTNNAIRYFAAKDGGNDRWMMYPRKGFWSLPLNVLHAGAVLFLVYTAYNMINGALIGLSGAGPDAVPLGVEPILFGLLCLGFDLALIGLKRGLKRVLADARRSAGRN